MNTENYIKFPNKYIRCDIRKDYGLSRWFYITYLSICLNRTLYNNLVSYISVGGIQRLCGKKTCDRFTDSTNEIISTLQYMCVNNWISLDNNLLDIKPSTHLTVTINEDKFFPHFNFSKVYYHQIQKLLSYDEVKTETLLMVFLYLNSYSFSNKECQVFTGSISTLATKLGLSKTTLSKCLKVLAGDAHDDKLFVKSDTGYRISGENICKLPNVYTDINNK